MAIIFDGEKKEDVSEMEKGFESETGITEVREGTELGESLKELNADMLEKDKRMSGIDMRSRLHYTEVTGILAVDILVGFKFLPMDCLLFTRQKKRLAVSLEGKGRQEIVDIVGGKREHDEKKGQVGFLERAKNFFTPQQSK